MGDQDRREDRRDRGGRGGGRGFNRKRRYDDDHGDRRQQKRRYEEPLAVKVRKEMLTIAESPLKRTEDEISSIAKTLAENFFDDELQNGFYDLLLQLIVEQPFKIPFVAAVVLTTNSQKPEVTQEILKRVGIAAQSHLEVGNWRELKLVLRFLGCLQSLFEGEGVFPLLEDLFERAVALQTASSEDGLGLEIVKIILLTIPYILASPATGLEEKALELLDKTDIIASTPHALESLVDPYTNEVNMRRPEQLSVIGLLQRQLIGESESDWKLACVPRPWQLPRGDEEDDPLLTAQKHAMPNIIVPDPVCPGSKLFFPEMFLSVYGEQSIETVPSTDNIASIILRDALVDTINILDYNRNATAKFLVDIDCYFPVGTFVKRATPFDRLREVAGERSTWKPEDVAIDAVFSQLFQLPSPEHKLIYFHSVLTESCKIAPAAIAPSLGRAIRYLYKHVDRMDLELVYRFMDWFAHHLSNFGFTWKWTEWIGDVVFPPMHPKKAFMIGALDKEIRLSFAQRIRGTLPEPYQPLIPAAKEKDTPDFKYDSDGTVTFTPPPHVGPSTTNHNLSDTPFSTEGRALLALLRKKTPDSDIQPIIDNIHAVASSSSPSSHAVSDPLIASTDAYVTAICYLGSKSLSHVLSAIERCKDRLLAIGPASPAARKQILTSVMSYWTNQPGIGVNIVDKLLNYTILTPMSVIEWVLIDHNDQGRVLAQSHSYEMVASTVFKVTNRVRQILQARDQSGLTTEQREVLDGTFRKEREEMVSMFRVIMSVLNGFAERTKVPVPEIGDGDADMDDSLEPGRRIQEWGARWLRVFRRKAAVEDAVVGEMAAAAAAVAATLRDDLESKLVQHMAARATAASVDGNGTDVMEVIVEAEVPTGESREIV